MTISATTCIQPADLPIWHLTIATHTYITMGWVTYEWGYETTLRLTTCTLTGSPDALFDLALHIGRLSGAHHAEQKLNAFSSN